MCLSDCTVHITTCVCIVILSLCVSLHVYIHVGVFISCMYTSVCVCLCVCVSVFMSVNQYWITRCEGHKMLHSDADSVYCIQVVPLDIMSVEI